jgi:hypothetical protein
VLLSRSSFSGMAFASSAILPFVPAMLPGTGGNLFDEQPEGYVKNVCD